MDGPKYPSNLTDEQWQLIRPLLPPASPAIMAAAERSLPDFWAGVYHA